MVYLRTVKRHVYVDEQIQTIARLGSFANGGQQITNLGHDRQRSRAFRARIGRSGARRALAFRGVSGSLLVFLEQAKLRTTERWQHALDQLGFDVHLDDSVDTAQHSGFWPAGSVDRKYPDENAPQTTPASVIMLGAGAPVVYGYDPRTPKGH